MPDSSEHVSHPDIHASWGAEPRDNLRERLKFSASELRSAAMRLGIPAEACEDLAVSFNDGHTIAVQDGTAESTSAYAHNSLTVGEGAEAHTYRHGLVISVRDENDELLSDEEINRAIWHELTHMRQVVVDGVDINKDILYNDQHTVRALRTAGRVALGAPAAGMWVGTVYAFYKTFEATEHLRELPPHQAAVAAGMGIAAVAVTAGAAFAEHAWKNNIRKVLHKASPYENEARNNEALADEAPAIVNIAEQ